jgi:hypothetical protein
MAGQFGLPVTEEEWIDLVGARRRQLARFLSWAAAREAVDSLRLSNRGDVRRVQGILDAFAEPWWAAVVYTCFDSEIGTLAVAQAFPHPVDPAAAARSLSRIDLPAGRSDTTARSPGTREPRLPSSPPAPAPTTSSASSEKGRASTTATRRCGDCRPSSGVARPASTFWFAAASSASGARGATSPTAPTSRTRPALGTGPVWSGDRGDPYPQRAGSSGREGHATSSLSTGAPRRGSGAGAEVPPCALLRGCTGPRAPAVGAVGDAHRRRSRARLDAGGVRPVVRSWLDSQ